MDLADYLLELATSYDRLAGLHTPAQTMLSDASLLLAEHCPAGILIQGGGGRGLATYTPWVGFFNPDETDSPQRGVYLVYIMSEDLEVVALTLNQGMEYLRKEFGDKGARDRLAGDAAAIRAALPSAELAAFADPMDLRSSGARQKAYEAGNIACRIYSVGALPDESDLRADLAAVLSLYEQAVAAKRSLLLGAPGTILSPSSSPKPHVADPLVNFRPKNDADYRATLVGRELVKTRRHEKLVADYGRWAGGRGFKASTEHPQDLVIRSSVSTHLVEGKIVYRGNVTEAVRAAVGQLYSYSYFLYDDAAKPSLVGLFGEDIGTAYVDFLESLGIMAVWWDEGSWKGSPSAIAASLTS